VISNLFPHHPHHSCLLAGKNAALPLKSSTIASLSNEDHFVKNRPLFRYVGMIQDMLETEYFSVNDVAPNQQGSLHPFASDAALKLAERTPMMLVSIPHTSDASTPGSNCSRAYENPCDSHLAKRVRYDDPDAPPSSVAEKPVPAVAPEVVAQFYLDQYPMPDISAEASDNVSRSSSHSLKLNQMVEILGILEEGTVAADPNDQNMGVEENHPTHRSNNNMHDMDYQESSIMLLEEQEITVIPSHIPRLHVLWYRTVTMDHEDEENDASATRISPSIAASLYHAWNKVGLTDCSVNDKDPTIGGWTAVSQVLGLLLHSQAERDPATGIVRSAPHNASTLGCVSLNLLFPNADEEPMGENRRDVAEFISYTMKGLVPHCQVLTFSNNPDSASMSTPLMAIQAPHKMCGRLRSTALQQPAGTLFIVDVRNWNAESGNHRDDAHHPFHSLRQICRHHLLQYMFDGGMQIPFEADYRVLVLSNAMSQHLIPCTLAMQVPSLVLGNVEQDWTTVLDPLLIPIRADVQRLRSQKATGTMRLDELVIERSQQEFCDRRRRSRDNKSGTKVDEADLHRWLTLCRIHALSRSSNMAEIEDWEAALKLDDFMLDSLKNNMAYSSGDDLSS
jgi:Mini-chromosome maintenance replisome factor